MRQFGLLNGARAVYDRSLSGRLGFPTIRLRPWESVRRAMNGAGEVTNFAGEHRLLQFPVRGAGYPNTVEGLVGRGFQQRGATVLAAVCNSILPACDNRVRETMDLITCESCVRTCTEMWQQGFSIPLVTYDEVISEDEIAVLKNIAADVTPENLSSLTYRNIDLSTFVYSSLLRFITGTEIPDNESGTELLHRYALAAIVTTEVTYRLIERFRPTVIQLSHGIYVTFGPVLAVARKMNIPAYIIARAYRKNTIMFSRNETAWDSIKRTGMDDIRRTIPYTEAQDAQLTQYLQSRTKGDQDHIRYNPRSSQNVSRITSQSKLIGADKTVAIFPNIFWDAAMAEQDAVFPTSSDWLIETVRKAHDFPSTHFVVRAHPAELRLPVKTTATAATVIETALGALPKNVSLVAPDDPLCSYRLMDLADLIVVYSSKMGLEAAARGKDVVVGGDSFYRRKGFTFDPVTPTKYFDFLNQTFAEDLPEDRVQRARHFAYYFFFCAYFPFRLYNDETFEINDDTATQLNGVNSGDLDNVIRTMLDVQDPMDPASWCHATHQATLT